MESADYGHLDILSWSKHKEEFKTRLDEFNKSIVEEGGTVQQTVTNLGHLAGTMIWALDTGEEGIILIHKGIYYEAVSYKIMPVLENEPMNEYLAPIIRAANKTIVRIKADAIVFRASLVALLKLVDNYSS